MNKTVTNESYVAAPRKRVAAGDSDMLSGQTPFLEGARELSSLRDEVAADEDDEDFLAFVVIDSDTDSLPIGDQRKHRSHEALLKLQPEIDEAIAWATALGTGACVSLLKRFGAWAGLKTQRFVVSVNDAGFHASTAAYDAIAFALKRLSIWA